MKSLLALTLLFSFPALQANAGSVASRSISSEDTQPSDETFKKWEKTIADYCPNHQDEECNSAYTNLHEGRFMSAIVHACKKAGAAELACYNSFSELDANLAQLLANRCASDLPAELALICKRELITFESFRQFVIDYLEKR